MLSILAGFMIGMGGIIYLTLGGIEGALFFSLGLMTIITFKFELFTGKAGLLATNGISFWKLCKIWLGNLLGTGLCGFLALMTPVGQKIVPAASNIVALRTSQTAFQNLVLGFFCGLLMYVAVIGFQKSNNYIFSIVPVAFFILCGFNHCVADMFYTWIGANGWRQLIHIIPTTIGNVLGACFIPLLERCHRGV